MAWDIPTNQEVVCYEGNDDAVCAKANGIVCGYETGAASACARAIGTPVPTACDCTDGD